MSVIGMLEAGRSFAERIPYSLLALVSRLVSGTAAAARHRRLCDDRRGTPVPGAADHRVCLATVGAGIIGHDECDPAICLSERVAPARPLDRPAAADHRPGTGRRFARSSRVESAPGRQDDSADSRCSPIMAPARKRMARFSAGSNSAVAAAARSAACAIVIRSARPPMNT